MFRISPLLSQASWQVGKPRAKSFRIIGDEMRGLTLVVVQKMPLKGVRAMLAALELLACFRRIYTKANLMDSAGLMCRLDGSPG